MNTAALLRVSVDEHPLKIVEVDSTPVDYIGGDVHQVPIAPAQRMSGIIDTTKGENGDAFWLRAAVANGESTSISID
jgi:FtsP/CotA-like multicopper oxidase with cupredoxin domain